MQLVTGSLYAFVAKYINIIQNVNMTVQCTPIIFQLEKSVLSPFGGLLGMNVTSIKFNIGI